VVSAECGADDLQVGRHVQPAGELGLVENLNPLLAAPQADGPVGDSDAGSPRESPPEAECCVPRSGGDDVDGSRLLAARERSVGSMASKASR